MEGKEQWTRPRGACREFQADGATRVKAQGQVGAWKRKEPGKAAAAETGSRGSGKGARLFCDSSSRILPTPALTAFTGCGASWPPGPTIPHALLCGQSQLLKLQTWANPTLPQGLLDTPLKAVS